MKIVTIGTGYVGIVHAAVCSEYGHDVYAYDIDKEKIKAFSSGQPEHLEKYVNEPGLFNIIRETLGKSLHFSDDLEAIIERFSSAAESLQETKKEILEVPPSVS